MSQIHTSKHTRYIRDTTTRDDIYNILFGTKEKTFKDYKTGIFAFEIMNMLTEQKHMFKKIDDVYDALFYSPNGEGGEGYLKAKTEFNKIKQLREPQEKDKEKIEEDIKK